MRRAPPYPQHKNEALANFRREQAAKYHREMVDFYRVMFPPPPAPDDKTATDATEPTP